MFLDILPGSTNRARKAYLKYVEAGVDQGRQENLTGGGFIRSVGGCSEVKRLRQQGQAHVMSDERILGHSEFVETLLSLADENYERHYELKRRGDDLDRIPERVPEIYGMQPHEIFPKGKQQRKIKVRSLLCFWAVSGLRISLGQLARRLEMSPPGVGFSVERGEAIARENGLNLIE
jgi:hypothetical protein